MTENEGIARTDLAAFDRTRGKSYSNADDGWCKNLLSTYFCLF